MNDDIIPYQVITLTSMVLGLLCIYLSGIGYGGVFSIIATALFVMLGSNTLRYVGKYSLGTGVPSIVYMLISVSVVVLLLSLVLANYLGNSYIMPLLIILFAVIFALIISSVCRYVFKIQVEILAVSFIKLVLSGAFTILSMATLICNSLESAVIFNNIYSNGFVILLMFMTIMIIQNPYNACMGPNEDQLRTLHLALAETFMMLAVLSFLSMINVDIWYVYLIISVILMTYFLYKYIKSTAMQAASIKYYGLWDNGDEGDY